MYVMVEYDSSE